MAIDLVMGLPPEESNYGHSMQDYLKRLQRDTFDAFQLAMKHLRASAERRKKSYNIRVKAEQFQVGDWVYYHYPRRYQKKISQMAEVIYRAISGHQDDRASELCLAEVGQVKAVCRACGQAKTMLRRDTKFLAVSE